MDLSLAAEKLEKQVLYNLTKQDIEASDVASHNGQETVNTGVLEQNTVDKWTDSFDRLHVISNEEELEKVLAENELVAVYFRANEGGKSLFPLLCVLNICNKMNFENQVTEAECSSVFADTMSAINQPCAATNLFSKVLRSECRSNQQKIYVCKMTVDASSKHLTTRQVLCECPSHLEVVTFFKKGLVFGEIAVDHFNDNELLQDLYEWKKTLFGNSSQK
jgi:hypothetical protein